VSSSGSAKLGRQMLACKLGRANCCGPTRTSTSVRAKSSIKTPACKPLHACRLLHIQTFTWNSCMQTHACMLPWSNPREPGKEPHEPISAPSLFSPGWSCVKQSLGIPHSLCPHVSTGLPSRIPSHRRNARWDGEPPRRAKPPLSLPISAGCCWDYPHSPAWCMDSGKQRQCPMAWSLLPGHRPATSGDTIPPFPQDTGRDTQPEILSPSPAA